MSPLEINAWLMRLIESEGRDEEARNAVVEIATDMESTHIVLSQKKTTTSETGKMTGQTDMGENVTVDLKSGQKQTEEKSWGDHSLRAGHFKIQCCKSKKGVLRTIEIRHFWKSDITTRSLTETPEEWLLYFDKAGQLEGFAKISEPVKVFRLGSLCSISQDYAIPTWSRSGNLEKIPRAKILEIGA